jgi:predicted DNA-binding transcriptional regulator YafY
MGVFMLTEKTYILCILSILQKYSDADHILSVKDIKGKMKAIYDVEVDRRTIYRNVNQLNDFGYDISTYEENRIGYYLREREFEPSELHMLADAVLTAEFIPEKEGKDLIQKLQQQGSIYQMKSLNRLGLVKLNKKAPNKEIFYTVEMLDEAITNKKQVEFEYVTYDLDLQQKPRRKEKYLVNPYALYWNNGQYYLISNMEPHEGICHFRLDRIKKINIKDVPVKEVVKGFDVYDYARNALYMFAGDTETFTIRCNRLILNDVIDRFGDGIIITDSDETTFTTIVKATTQGMRIWAIHYFTCCKVLAPDWLVQDVSESIRRGMKIYNIE